MAEFVHTFAQGRAEGGAGDTAVLGHKGAHLAEIASLGLPVPAGFTLSSAALAAYRDNGGQLTEALKAEIIQALGAMTDTSGRRYGDPDKPFLVAVRAGSQRRLPGILSSVPNVGLNDQTVEGLAALSGNEDFAYDLYRRFIDHYTRTVLMIDPRLLSDIKPAEPRTDAGHPAAGESRRVIADYQTAIAATGRPLMPQDPHDQLWQTLTAVFDSWQTPRAKALRKAHGLTEAPDASATVQMMVFGDLDADSASGYAVTRHPDSGRPRLYGEMIPQAQGRHPMPGAHTVYPLTAGGDSPRGKGKQPVSKRMPGLFRRLSEICDQLERHYLRVQEISFTVESGRLWILQTEDARLSPGAAIKVAVDMAKKGLIDRQEAVRRIEPTSLDRLLHASIAADAEPNVIARGLPASPGAASGVAVFSALEARRRGKEAPVILVRVETSPEDVHGMTAANGILTTRGGMTSHAAVVTRALGRACVCAARDIRIDQDAKTLHAGDEVISEGEPITIDGSTGSVIKGAVPLTDPDISGDFATLLRWADGYRRLKVRANAETREELKTAARFGADGVGLCRTEHMFFDRERIVTMREMIMARDEAGRRAALQKLLPIQRSDFIDLFTRLQDQPVTIRLLDPPLHEFLPRNQDEFAELAEATGVDIETVQRRAIRLTEANPMLGHRGCRLAITYPEIYEMQARAIFEAALESADSDGAGVELEIMVPLVAARRELDLVKRIIDDVAAAVFSGSNDSIPYKVGAMIELPRAALCADDIAEVSDFFSFGTNDLTQTVLGLSRDDAGAFIPAYREHEVFDCDPFVTLDEKGVGVLISQAAEAGRKKHPGIVIGICGEHGGDPDSIRFCEKIGLDYVSCSPYRVPIARLAAAQSALEKLSQD